MRQSLRPEAQMSKFRCALMYSACLALIAAMNCGSRECRGDEKATSRPAPLARLDAVRAGAVSRCTTEQERRELNRLFDAILAERTRLLGTDPWNLPPDQRAPGAERPDKELVELLATAGRRAGVAVPAAVLFDSTQRDYVRNAAVSALMGHDRYTLDDLPVLTRVFMHLAEEPEPRVAHAQIRHWVNSRTARVRLAHTMRGLLGVVIQKNEVSAFFRAAATEPDAFLTNLLERAMGVEQNRGRVDLIAACLVTLGGSPTRLTEKSRSHGSA
jgi:hypothetical protein